MRGKLSKDSQLNFFKARLELLLNMEHELVKLSTEIDWDEVEAEFSIYYSDIGRPGVPVRKIVGLLLLKRMFDQSDESVVDRWIENPYWQYFTGEEYFQTQKPFDPSDFVHFRQRVGQVGMEKILALTIKLHAKAITEKEVLVDTTVQEKNITFPTDAKLQHRIIGQCWKIAQQTGIPLRQSYKRTLRQLMIDQRFRKHPKRRKKANWAARKLKTIAGRLIRELYRKLDEQQLAHYAQKLKLFEQVLAQKRSDSNKIYSLHAPEVCCIAKGKEKVAYEFGSKVVITRTSRSGIIIGGLSFNTNIYDGKTLGPALDQAETIRNAIGGNRPKVAIVDRGCKGPKQIKGTQIIIPSPPSTNVTPYQKQKIRKRFRARAGIEPVISHLKFDHRMWRNFLSGSVGDSINVLLAAAGFNLKKKLNLIKKELKKGNRKFWAFFVQFTVLILPPLKGKKIELIPF